MWDSSLFIIPSSDVRFKSSCRHSWVFMKNIEFSKLTLFPVQIRDSSLLYTYSWVFMKNIVFFSKFTFYQAQIWDSSLFHAVLWVFIKRYRIFNDHIIPSSDKRINSFHAVSWVFMKKYRIFKNITLLLVQIRDSNLFHACWKCANRVRRGFSLSIHPAFLSFLSFLMPAFCVCKLYICA